MNNINEVQNSSKVLDALFAQRHLYSRAKKCELTMFIIPILNCLIANIPSSYVNKEAIFICLLIIYVISIALKNVNSNDYEKAAEIQEYVDRTIYGIRIKKNRIDKYSVDSLKRIIKSINIKHKEKSEAQKNATGDSEEHGVKDWYVGINESLEKKYAIYKCQEQNTWWDENNNKTYKKVLCVFYLIVFAVLLIAFRNGSFGFLIASLEPISSILSLNSKMHKYENVSREIRILENTIDTDNINMSDLEEIQAKIFERRKIGYSVPDFIDKFKSKELHEIYKED